MLQALYAFLFSPAADSVPHEASVDEKLARVEGELSDAGRQLDQCVEVKRKAVEAAVDLRALSEALYIELFDHDAPLFAEDGEVLAVIHMRRLEVDALRRREECYVRHQYEQLEANRTRLDIRRRFLHLQLDSSRLAVTSAAQQFGIPSSALSGSVPSCE